ncbi:glycosyltransferase family 2 protein [Hymenobacter actinosclerus]|uniref:Alpha-1,3-rhamnosyltransferase n=1 Tax=Hymenobacter actinosclerus TaxID=82805 RepID=A0A1I0GZ14_9BACT|nr:glycosyltransferase [Hymenobacter actinosclerus]SET75750.1 alpha-1,3-rhamnosyltransferase [Hymenobacter actinosclerus]
MNKEMISIEVPLVSVCMSSYNNSKYLIHTLESIKSQSYSNIELIIIDDYSTDDSVAKIDEWLEKQAIKYVFVKHEFNKGVCAVANEMLKQSSGKYMSIIASDDMMMPDKLSVQVPILESSEDDVAFVFSDAYIMNERGEMQGESLLKKSKADIEDLLKKNVFENLLRRDFVPAPSILFKTQLLEEMGGFDGNLFYEDWDMLLRLARKYKFVYSDYISVKYRLIPTSIWHSRSTKFYESTAELLVKHFGYSAEGDAIINEHVNEQAELIYKTGGASASKWLKKRWQNQRSLTAGLLYVMASLGLPYKAFDLLRGTLRT